MKQDYGRISLDYPGSVRGQHLLAPNTNKTQKPAKSPDFLLCKVTEPSNSQFSKITHREQTECMSMEKSIKH